MNYMENKIESKKLNVGHGVGRRKSCVARVWLKPGKGNVLINDRKVNNYFGTLISRQKIYAPFKVIGCDKDFDVKVNVDGGGNKGQADAIRLGISRALLSIDEDKYRAVLKKKGFLSVDSRLKERKKYGQKGARRKFQFVKR